MKSVEISCENLKTDAVWTTRVAFWGMCITMLFWMMPGSSYALWPLDSWHDQEVVEEERDVPVAISEAEDFSLRVNGLAGELISNLEKTNPSKSDLSGALIVCTFVELKKMYRTSSLGRYLSEQLMNAFQQHAYTVVEARKTKSVLIEERYGEYGLSRDTEEIRSSVTAAAMLTGTYMVLGDHVVVTAKIIDNETATLLSSVTTMLPRNELCNNLLADSSTAGSRKGVTYLKRLEL